MILQRVDIIMHTLDVLCIEIKMDTETGQDNINIGFIVVEI